VATIYREFKINCTPEHAWEALRDFATLHERLAKGFVVQCEATQDLRKITFMNGMTITERLIGIDEGARRLAYTVVGGSAEHHSASAQIVSDGSQIKFIWITDVLPDSMAPGIAQMMDAGAKSIAATLSET
jgi:hypothetical protein